MAIKIEFDSLIEAARAIGNEDDFTARGWSFIEDCEFHFEDTTMASSTVENMSDYYKEYTLEEYIGDNHLDTPEDVDFSEISIEDARGFLYNDCHLEGIVGVYADDDGEVRVLTFDTCSYPEQDAWHNFLSSKGYTAMPDRDSWDCDLLWALEESAKGGSPIWYDFTDNEFMLCNCPGHECAIVLDGLTAPEGENIGDWAADYLDAHGDDLWRELVEEGSFEKYTAAHPLAH